MNDFRGLNSTLFNRSAEYARLSIYSLLRIHPKRSRARKQHPTTVQYRVKQGVKLCGIKKVCPRFILHFFSNNATVHLKNDSSSQYC
mmetsp:Transcript_10210/g.11726  ORF Transcript_10210/g.11726 Transcript_10210/m.11726 type:complete len:87 (+) Transcript_10210:928-1188(+)